MTISGKFACLVAGLAGIFWIPAEAAEVRIAAQVGDGPARVTERAEARLDAKVTLHAVIVERGAEGIVYRSGELAQVEVDGKARQVEKWGGAAPRVRWFKVEPVMMHAPGEGNDPTVPRWLWYTNAYTPGSPNGQRWIGFDKIEYRENPLEGMDGKWSIAADARPTDKNYDRAGGRGVMRYSVEIEIEGKKLRTPGAKATNYLGAEERIFKLLVREDDTYMGAATTFCNVPGVFGSHPLQVDRHIGVDCADLVVGARRLQKGEKSPEYTNVNGLPEFMEKVGGVLALREEGPVTVDDGTSRAARVAFERGAAVMIDFPGTRRGHYDHVGILYQDDGDGVVGPDDVILEAGPMEPSFTLLKKQAYGDTARIQLLRWRGE